MLKYNYTDRCKTTLKFLESMSYCGNNITEQWSDMHVISQRGGVCNFASTDYELNKCLWG